MLANAGLVLASTGRVQASAIAAAAAGRDAGRLDVPLAAGSFTDTSVV